MKQNDKISFNDSQGDPPAYLQILLKGDKWDIEMFKRYYARRVEHIIERIKNDKSSNKNMKLYKAFQDKLPDSEELASRALEDFIKKLQKDNGIKQSGFWKKLRDTIREYTEEFLDEKNIRHFIDREFKQLSKETHQGSKKAEDRLRDYEKNVLIMIQDLSSASCLCIDHMHVANLVINELIAQVKKNGPKDSKGKYIRSFYSYIYKIIKCRMKDQYKRVFRYDQLDEDHHLKRSIYSMHHYEKDINELINLKELVDILFHKLFMKLEPIERLILYSIYIEGKKSKDIINDIFIEFQEKFSEPKLSRRKKEALEKLQKYYISLLTERDLELACFN